MNRDWRISPIGVQEEHPAVVRLIVPDRAALDALLALGLDLCEYRSESAGGVEVHACLTPGEMAALQREGYTFGELLWTDAHWKDQIVQREATLARERAITAAVDVVSIVRSCFFENPLATYLHVEAITSAGAVPGVILTASWDTGEGTEMGSGGTAPLVRTADARGYLHHRMVLPVSVLPAQICVSTSLGGVAAAGVTVSRDGSNPDGTARHYVTDFTSHYMDPTELDGRMAALAREFSSLAEIIDLPFATGGYRRKAQTVLGSTPEASLVVTSQAVGHEGGNALSVELIDPGIPNQHLSVSIRAHQISVRLGTDAAGRPVSTAAQVAEALNAEAADLVTAITYAESAGTGVMAPQAETGLRDNLKAPQEISREPYRVRALRIGKYRDGTRPGVMAYAQEHAREWVTPLVAIEAAERLLRNYGHDAETAQLVDALDIFIIPSVNPDGAHYSLYDFSMQRKNMVHTTQAAHLPHGAPELRDYWGVDLNRNYRVGSVFDGYSGASTNCLSQTYAGPARLSEAESRNLIWLAEQYPTIKFAMNIHSYGGYVMWVPGAYKAADRVTLERPSPDQESLFRTAAEQMVTAIKARRGTSILPERVGAGVDVLYSAAGNSTDQLWYEKAIFGWEFEVGADLAIPGTGGRSPVGFQPPFAEGHEEAMEFADGLIALFKFVKDRGAGREAER